MNSQKMNFETYRLFEPGKFELKYQIPVPVNVIFIDDEKETFLASHIKFEDDFQLDLTTDRHSIGMSPDLVKRIEIMNGDIPFIIDLVDPE